MNLLFLSVALALIAAALDHFFGPIKEPWRKFIFVVLVIMVIIALVAWVLGLTGGSVRLFP